MSTFLMNRSIVKPFRPLRNDGLIGYEGENGSRNLIVRTHDDLDAFETISLVIDETDCGAMSRTAMEDGSVMLSITLTSGMLGRAGRKTCQLIMTGEGGTITGKSSQFEAYVGRANEIERSVDDGVTIIILSEAVTEMAREAAAAAAQEAAADVVEDCQTIADAASASADAAAQSASDAQTAAASITVDSTLDPTSTNAIQNKVVAEYIALSTAQIDALTDLLE